MLSILPSSRASTSYLQIYRVNLVTVQKHYQVTDCIHICINLLFMLWIFIIFIHQQTTDMKQKYKTKFYIIQNKTMAQNTADTFSLRAFTSSINNVICKGKHEAYMKGSGLLTKLHELNSTTVFYTINTEMFGLCASF